MFKNNFSAYITFIMSLVISFVSGYCTVIGMGKVFASASIITMCIATVIEIGRVILLYDLHHYWEKLKLYQKIPGIIMLLIAMSLSAMGVYGFFANAHSAKSQEVLPIEMIISQKQSEIDMLKNSIQINEEQISQFDNKAYSKYTELGYVTKAVNLQKEQQKITNELYNDNREKQLEITKLNNEITQLKIDIEKKAPTLAHLKYYAKLFNVDDETAIIIFIVMIMMVFDTLAMYLMITADWIAKIDDNNEFNTTKYCKNDCSTPIQNNVINDTINNINEMLIKSNNCIDELNLKQNEINQNIKNIIAEDKQEDVISLLSGIKSSMNNNNLSEKLSFIENKLCQYKNDKKIEEIQKNNIDKNSEKIISLITENKNLLDTYEFKQYLLDNKQIYDSLKQYYQNDNQILKKLTNL